MQLEAEKDETRAQKCNDEASKNTSSILYDALQNAIENGLCFLHEHPYSASSWKETCVEEVMVMEKFTL